MNFNQLRDKIMARIGKTEYVIVVKDGNHFNLIVDPGLGLPWHNQNKRRADEVAHEANGMAMTFEDAWKFLMKNNMGSEQAFEKVLTDRIKKQARIVESQLMKDTSTGEIVDKHGNPVRPKNN